MLTPLILRHLGPEEIALWYLFANIVALASVLDLGFTPTFVRMVAFVLGGAKNLRDLYHVQPKHEANVVDWSVMERLYRTMGVIYVLLSVVLVLALATVGTYAVRRALLQIPNPAEGWIAWSFVVISLAFGFYGARWTAALQGLNYVAKSNRSTALAGLLSLFGSSLYLLLKGGLCGTVIVYQALNALAVISNRWYLLRVEGAKFAAFSGFKFDREMFSAAWPASWRSGIVVGFSTGITNLSGVIYAQLSSSSNLASFLLTTRLLSLVVTISQAPFYSQTPLYARLRASGDTGVLAARSSRAMTVALTVLIVGILALAILGDRILEVIGANISLLGGPYILAYGFVYLLERHHAMHAQIYCTTNRIPFYIPICISGIINLGLTWCLIGKFGIWSFLIAHAVSNALINNWWNVWISLRSMPENRRGAFWEPGFAVILGTLLLALSALVVTL